MRREARKLEKGDAEKLIELQTALHVAEEALLAFKQHLKAKIVGTVDKNMNVNLSYTDNGYIVVSIHPKSFKESSEDSY